MSAIAAHDVPNGLVDAILRGRCIAFVGAGFSAPAVPKWGELLRDLVTQLKVPDLKVPENATAFEYELIGQALRDATHGDDNRFEVCVKQALERKSKDDGECAKVRERVRLLENIPFKAILTTNFDSFLPGTGADPYRNVLREHIGRWWDFPVQNIGKKPAIPVIKLHGDANGDPTSAALVLGRGDYRRRLYGEHGYTGFIRAAFASYTPLFLGVSFTDAYLNELRSETLSFLYPPKSNTSEASPPWGYAVMNVKGNFHLPALYEKHEHIKILQTREHEQFDEWLKAIESRTSAQGRLRTLIEGKHIVWLDPRPNNNDQGRQVFESCGAKVTPLTSEHDLSERAHAQADLLITHFGAGGTAEDARAYRVLSSVRGWRTGPPVVVFTESSTPDQHRRDCIRRGAWEYATQWGELYRLIERLFAPGAGMTGP